VDGGHLGHEIEAPIRSDSTNTASKYSPKEDRDSRAYVGESFVREAASAHRRQRPASRRRLQFYRSPMASAAARSPAGAARACGQLSRRAVSLVIISDHVRKTAAEMAKVGLQLLPSAAPTLPAAAAWSHDDPLLNLEAVGEAAGYVSRKLRQPLM